VPNFLLVVPLIIRAVVLSMADIQRMDLHTSTSYSTSLLEAPDEELLTLAEEAYTDNKLIDASSLLQKVKKSETKEF
jgi:hypothetical protein